MVPAQERELCLRICFTYETLQGVLGSVENGVQKYREQGAWSKLRKRGADSQILKGAGSGGPPLAEPHL